MASSKRPALSIIAPTYNEKANVRPFVAAVQKVLGDTDWELIFVDDDSPDGTWAEILDLSRQLPSVRCIRRIGRRGLASAVVEGAMSASADLLVVIDADMQHDETLLPKMLEILRTTDADIVIGSRNIEGGGLGDWGEKRKAMSAFATRAARSLIGEQVSDPMSGFFMARRSVFDAAIYDLSQQGYKILLDILSSSPRQLRVVELPYVFRARGAGESKVDTAITLEYAFLLIEKLTRGLIPPRFVMFCFVGGLGLVFHLVVLGAAQEGGLSFLRAQTVATLSAMTFNFFLNNVVTYHTERLKGANLLVGWLVFCIVCSVGGIANISVAGLVMHQFEYWALAGIAGALMSAVFNFGVSTRFVWGRRRRPHVPVVRQPHGAQS